MKRFKRYFCGLLAVFMVVLCATPQVAYAETYKEKADRLQAEYEAAQKQLAGLKNDKKKAEQTKQTLVNQQYIVTERIAALVQGVNEKTAEIALQEQAIADKQADIDARWDGFKSRMQAMQVMQDSGAVAMITSAESLYDLLTYQSAIQQTSKKDSEVLEDMRVQKAALQVEKDALEAAKAELEEAEAELEAEQERLSQNIQAQNTAISKAAANAEAQETVVNEKQKAYEEANRQYEAWVSANASSGSGISAEGFMWPAPGLSRITTYFGASQNVNGVVSSGHKGIDIAGPAGSPVVAAHAGRVSATSGHWTYGNVVMIDNGDGVLTLYAHLSSSCVSVGQTVAQGQKIGAVGSTGNSTGNHLHFEVRVNNVLQNPFNFVSVG